MKLKKLIATIIASITITMMLASCEADLRDDTATAFNDSSQDYWKMIIVEEEKFSGGKTIFMDPVTKVLYLTIDKVVTSGAGCGITVMLDPETGLPLTYDRYMDMKEGR